MHRPPGHEEVPTISQSATRADLVVVGGGVVGLSCAWRAARAGLDVVVLERERPGAGASGVAAGMLAPVGEATFGAERLLEMALAAARRWPAFARELEHDSGQSPGHLPLGALHVALDADEAAELRRRFDLMQRHELEAEWLTPSRCRELEPGLSPRLAGGILAPGEAAVDPRTLVAALARAAQARGARIRVGREVRDGVREGGRLVGVVTSCGERHLAGEVLLATGAWAGVTPWLEPEERPPVRPVKGQILELQGPPGEPVLERIVASERIYLVPRADGRLAVGATVEERGFDVRATAGGLHELLREAYRALPDVAELEVESIDVGLRPGSPGNLPLVGRGAPDGLLLATGHFRNGILLAPDTAARIVAELGAVDAGEPGTSRSREAIGS